MQHKIGICITTYNDSNIIETTLESALHQKTTHPYSVFIVDDGSTDSTPEILSKKQDLYPNLEIQLSPHRERGITRYEAIENAINANCNYLLFIDSDMIIDEELVEKCTKMMLLNELSALVIPEKPFSDYNNYMTKVKILERELINSNGANIDSNSIEAARFWRTDEYIRSGKLNPNQISFEETQPTIRIIEQGGRIKRITDTYLLHNEGYVSFTNIIKKKLYYFSQMNQTLSTEKGGLFKALKRWYFFRPYLYNTKAIKSIFTKPLLYLGVINMYIALTCVGAISSLTKK